MLFWGEIHVDVGIEDDDNATVIDVIPDFANVDCVVVDTANRAPIERMNP